MPTCAINAQFVLIDTQIVTQQAFNSIAIANFEEALYRVREAINARKRTELMISVSSLAKRTENQIFDR